MSKAVVEVPTDPPYSVHVGAGVLEEVVGGLDSGDGVALLADQRGSILAINPAAEQRLAISSREALGRALDAVLDQCEDPPRIDLTPIRANGQQNGQLVLLDLPPKPGASPAKLAHEGGESGENASG